MCDGKDGMVMEGDVEGVMGEEGVVMGKDGMA